MYIYIYVYVYMYICQPPTLTSKASLPHERPCAYLFKMLLPLRGICVWGWMEVLLVCKLFIMLLSDVIKRNAFCVLLCIFLYNVHY